MVITVAQVIIREGERETDRIFSDTQQFEEPPLSL